MLKQREQPFTIALPGRAKKTVWQRAASLACALLLLAVAASPSAFAETPAEKYERLKRELAAIGEAITATQNDMEQAEAYRSSLAKQKALLDELIELSRQEIASTEAALAQKEAEAAAKRQEIYENDQLFQQRLQAIYRMNNANALSSLLHVNSFTELLTVSDSLQRISKHDTDLLALLASQRAELEAQQAEIDAMLADLQAIYADREENARQLAANIAATDQRISAAEAELAAQKAVYDDTKAAAEQAYREMLAASNAASGTGSSRGDGSQYVGGVFRWPLDGYYTITCQFGGSDPAGRGHLGTDISAPTGTPIHALGSGTVITATYHSSYGNYMVIDHGNGVKTLYAHASQLLVGVGQIVSTGDNIALVGSTGYSTGPHLHLEVHDGGRQNPLNYLRG